MKSRAQAIACLLAVVVVVCLADVAPVSSSPPASFPSHHHPRSAPIPAGAGSEYPGENLYFMDDFNELNLAVWQHEITMSGGGNWEFEWYTNNRSTSYVRDSVLYIKPGLTSALIGEDNVLSGYTMDNWGSTPADLCTGNSFYGCLRTSGAGGNPLNPIQSAALRTVHSVNVQYGRFEVRARLPRGDWLWPAIWLMPTYNSYGDWPASGEVDIMESKGNAAGSQGRGVDSFGSTLNWGPMYQENRYPLTHAVYRLTDNSTFADAFHVFGLKWSNSSMYTYVDTDDAAHRVLTVDYSAQSFWQLGGFDQTAYDNPWEGRPNAAPFDQPMYLILDVACGGVGGYFPDGVDGKPWNDHSATATLDFYKAKDQWYPSWQPKVSRGEHAAMAVDWVKIWQ